MRPYRRPHILDAGNNDLLRAAANANMQGNNIPPLDLGILPPVPQVAQNPVVQLYQDAQPVVQPQLQVTVPTTQISVVPTIEFWNSPTPVVGGWPDHLNTFDANPGTVMSPEIEGTIREAASSSVVQHYQPPQQYGASSTPFGNDEHPAIVTWPIPPAKPLTETELKLKEVRSLLGAKIPNPTKTPREVYNELCEYSRNDVSMADMFVRIITERQNPLTRAKENRDKAWEDIPEVAPADVYRKLYNFFELPTDSQLEYLKVLKKYGKGMVGKVRKIPSSLD
uniref:CUT domain-containing protein n=1 Tax=Caenorhabditis tropicalis TaxID=1561998 RepID=A0A1I7UVE0_9PELO